MATRKRATKSEDAQFKVIMVGRSAAGKSSLLTRYTKNVFTNDYTVTVGTCRLRQGSSSPPNSYASTTTST